MVAKHTYTLPYEISNAIQNISMVENSTRVDIRTVDGYYITGKSVTAKIETDNETRVLVGNPFSPSMLVVIYHSDEDSVTRDDIIAYQHAPSNPFSPSEELGVVEKVVVST